MRRKGFYPRFAARSIGLNKAMYWPYLLMSMLMIAVFYIMCYLSAPDTLSAMGAGSTIKLVMDLGVIVVGVFAAIFLYYCSTFLTGRRMKEYGLYNVLGMGKRNIARIMLWETALTFIVSLAGGLLLGISLARAAEILMIRIMDAKITTVLSINADAVLLSAEVFGGVFAVILLVNLMRMRLSNPMALIKSERVGEKPPKANYLVALIGAVLLGFGYYLAVTVDNPMTAIVFFFLAVLAVIGGSYLLFMSGSVALCRVLQRNKRYYYKTNHFVSLSSMTFRMKRNGAGLASICILCTMVLVILSSTLCLYTGIEDLLRICYPQDMAVALTRNGDDGLSQADENAFYDAVESSLYSLGYAFDNPRSLRTHGVIGYIQGGNFVTGQDIDPLFANGTQILLYPLSDLENLTGEHIALHERELLFHALKGNDPGESLAFFGGEEYAMTPVETIPEVFAAPCYRISYDCLLLFAEDFDDVRDMMVKNADPLLIQETEMYIYFDSSAQGEENKALCKNLGDALRKEMNMRFEAGQYRLKTVDRFTASEELYGMYGGLFFIGLILGGVFALAAVLIIYYKQISEGYEDAGRFALMRQIGLTDDEIHHSITSQVLTVFFAPLLMAGLHVLFSMPMVRLVLRAFGMHNATLFYSVSGICFAVFALIYAAVYFITSRTYYKIVR